MLILPLDKNSHVRNTHTLAQTLQTRRMPTSAQILTERENVTNQEMLRVCGFVASEDCGDLPEENERYRGVRYTGHGFDWLPVRADVLESALDGLRASRDGAAGIGILDRAKGRVIASKWFRD